MEELYFIAQCSLVGTKMSRRPAPRSTWSGPRHDIRFHSERAKIWSDASLDEEEEYIISRSSSVGCIELEPENRVKTALRVIHKHDKFDRFIRDALHYLLCTNNILSKPFREVWISKESPFTEIIGSGMLVEQIISRLSLKAIFLSKTIRHVKDACDIIEFVFSQRKAELKDKYNLLMIELCVIAFEVFLYCLIQEMLVLPMKDVVRVCTSIYAKMLKPGFEKKRRCWVLLEKYAVMYGSHFVHLKMIFKTLGHPYDVFAIPNTLKELWENKADSITRTFYDSVPLWNFHLVLKDYKEEVNKLDLKPDSHFQTRVIMRKAAIRKKYRRAKLVENIYGVSDTDSDVDRGAKPKSHSSVRQTMLRRANLMNKSDCKVPEKEKIDEKRRKSRKVTISDTRPKSRISTNNEALGAVRGRVMAGKDDETLGAMAAEDYGTVGAIGIKDDKNVEAKGSNDDETLGVLDVKDDITEEAIGGRDSKVSCPKCKVKKRLVSEKSKQSILTSSKTLSSSRVSWDEEALPVYKPGSTKRKLKPQKKKEKAPYVPEQSMSDLECLHIYRDRTYDRPRVPQPTVQLSQGSYCSRQAEEIDTPALSTEDKDNEDKKDSNNDESCATQLMIHVSQGSDLKLQKDEIDPPALPVETREYDDIKKDSGDDGSRVPPMAHSSQGTDLKLQKVEIDPPALPVEAKEYDNKKGSLDDGSRVPQSMAHSSQGTDLKLQKDEIDPPALLVEAKEYDNKKGSGDDGFRVPQAMASFQGFDPKLQKDEIDPPALPVEAKEYDDKKDSDDDQSLVLQPLAQSTQGSDLKAEMEEIDPLPLPLETEDLDVTV